MNSISAAAPTVTRPVGRRPVTRLVSRTRDPPPRTSSRADDRVQFRDRRPRYLPVRSRGGVGRRYARSDIESNGTLVPVDRRRRSCASAHQTGTLYQVRRARLPDRVPKNTGVPCDHALRSGFRAPPVRQRSAGRRPTSFDPSSHVLRTAVPGRLPDRGPGPEGMRPAPATSIWAQLLSGEPGTLRRRITVRFAGGMDAWGRASAVPAASLPGLQPTAGAQTRKARAAERPPSSDTDRDRPVGVSDRHRQASGPRGGHLAIGSGNRQRRDHRRPA
jgi:hypothetical protein